jgi:hypothetical protein
MKNSRLIEILQQAEEKMAGCDISLVEGPRMFVPVEELEVIPLNETWYLRIETKL